MTRRSASPLTLTPGTPVPGAGANVDPALTYRAGEGYWDWLDHVWPAAGCTRPIQLRGTLTTLDPTTGEVTDTRHTSTMPDGAIYKACGNRRHTVCPSCAETYRRDAYQLIRAGLVGGKTVDGDTPGAVRHVYGAVVRAGPLPRREAAHLPEQDSVPVPARTLPRPPRRRDLRTRHATVLHPAAQRG